MSCIYAADMNAHISCRLLEMPTELLWHVYDMLEISERTRLNMALPRAACITSTTRTTPDNDKKLSVVHRLFKRRNQNAGSASVVAFADLSCPMRRFFQQNRCDPTIRALEHDWPFLAHVSQKPCIDPVALIRQELLQRTGSIVWSDLEEYDDAVIHELNERGSPEIFDSCMSCDNSIRTRINKNAGTFVFGLVNYRNARGLLAHIMALEENNTFGFPVKEARTFLSRMSTTNIFLDEPCKLRVIVEEVGVAPSILAQLIEQAAGRLLMHTVTYLLQAGATL